MANVSLTHCHRRSGRVAKTSPKPPGELSTVLKVPQTIVSSDSSVDDVTFKISKGEPEVSKDL